MYVETVLPEAATGAVRELYDADRASIGYVATDTLLFSLRPEVHAAWRGLVKVLRRTIHLRRYELVTIAAARALGCRACVSAHGAVLLRNHVVDLPQLEAIVRDFRSPEAFYSKTLESLGVPPSPELIETNRLLDLVEDRSVALSSC